MAELGYPAVPSDAGRGGDRPVRRLPRRHRPAPGSTATARPRRRCRARPATRRPTASSTTTSPASRCRPTRACGSPRRTSSSTRCSSASTCTRTGWFLESTRHLDGGAGRRRRRRQPAVPLRGPARATHASRSTTPPPTSASTATGSSSSSSPSGTASTRSGRSGSAPTPDRAAATTSPIEAVRHFVESRGDTFPQVYAGFVARQPHPAPWLRRGSRLPPAPARRLGPPRSAAPVAGATGASAYRTCTSRAIAFRPPAGLGGIAAAPVRVGDARQRCRGPGRAGLPRRSGKVIDAADQARSAATAAGS